MAYSVIGMSDEAIPDICPPHPGFFGGLCVRCGQVEDDDASGTAFGYIHKVTLQLNSHLKEYLGIWKLLIGCTY